jgi:uncharacterized membrane protein
MTAVTRVTLLRGIAVVALLASGVLMADSLHPERGYCPLDAACDKARRSPLGTIAGVPTSAVGAGAFGAVLLLTFLPLGWVRRILRPAGLVAAFSALVFIAYQLIVLRSICPYCIVADTAGLAVGATVMGWRPPTMRMEKDHRSESLGARLRWTVAAGVVLAAPVLWPRGPAAPGWVPLPEAASVDFAPLREESPATSSAPATSSMVGGIERDDPSPASAVEDPPPSVADPAPPVAVAPAPTPVEAPSAPPSATPSPPAPTASPEPTPPRAVVLPAPEAPPRVPERRPAPAPAASPAPAPPAAPSVVIVEYLNAHCGHCRATHDRLERVLSTMRVTARRARVYVWSTGEPPLWAKACACAPSAAQEAALFEALLRGEQDDRAVWDAVARAGLDAQAISACIARREPDARLAAERGRVLAARLAMLPTFDIGRRRLQGEQSEAELRDAIEAAVADARPRR